MSAFKKVPVNVNVANRFVVHLSCEKSNKNLCRKQLQQPKSNQRNNYFYQTYLKISSEFFRYFILQNRNFYCGCHLFRKRKDFTDFWEHSSILSWFSRRLPLREFLVIDAWISADWDILENLLKIFSDFPECPGL